MTLRELRKARQLTQLSVARELGISQHGVSRLEQRSDLLLSTLRRTVEAMGGSLSLIATFPDRPPVELSGIAARETRDRLYLRRRAPLPVKRTSLAEPSDAWRSYLSGSCGSAGDGRVGGGRSRAAVTLVAALLTACSFEYSDADASPTQLLEHIPETELTEVTPHHRPQRAAWRPSSAPAKVRNFPRAGRT